MFQVNIYIESTLRGFRKQSGMYGAVVEYRKTNGDIETRSIFGSKEATANQIMLIALTESLKLLNKECVVNARMDSEYISNMLAQGLPDKWIENNWKNAKNEPVANKEEWQQLLEQMKKHKVSIVCQSTHEYKQWLVNEMKKQMEGKT